LIIQTVLAAVALLVAGVAIVRARRTAKRLERMQESYWDLRYELGQLQARVNRLEAGSVAAQPAPPAPPQTAGAAHFVPLSSLKR
jgi:hypothetical protein